MPLCLLRRFTPSLLLANGVPDKCLSSTERVAWTAPFEGSVGQGRNCTLRANKGILMDDDRAGASPFDLD